MRTELAKTNPPSKSLSNSKPKEIDSDPLMADTAMGADHQKGMPSCCQKQIPGRHVRGPWLGPAALGILVLYCISFYISDAFGYTLEG